MPTDLPSSATDAADYGFGPEASGLANAAALQAAVDRGGTVVVTRPGVYAIARTVLVGSDTAVHFGHGVVLRKVAEDGPFTHVLLNRAALAGGTDAHILIDGLQLRVDGVDQAHDSVYGLRGQIAFLHVRDLCIRGFRCHDLGSAQFAIHVCTFEDLVVEDVIIQGAKDGVHLGRGRRFVIRDGVFRTVDDAIALNAHDYATSNPELGWIEQGLVERCHDLAAPDQKTVGFFCRILAGAWGGWRAGMELQHSDSVVNDGRLYRVAASPDGTVFTSHTPPTHAAGTVEHDGIPWAMVQTEAVTSCGVRDVTFRSITLEKPRIPFSIHFDADRYSRSWYPGSEAPVQQRLLIEDLRVLHDAAMPVLNIGTPVDAITLRDCALGPHHLRFADKGGMGDCGATRINLLGCQFRHPGELVLIEDSESGTRRIALRIADSTVLSPAFRAAIADGVELVASDLPQPD